MGRYEIFSKYWNSFIDVYSQNVSGGTYDDEMLWEQFDLFVEDSGETKVKTENVIRKIPVHPQLIELGFIGSVGTLKNRKEKECFGN